MSLDKKLMRREFYKGQKVFLFNSKLKLFPRKLRSRWFGTFEVTNVLPFGAIEVTHPIKKTFKVNGQRLKPYIDGGFDKLKVSIPLCDPQGCISKVQLRDTKSRCWLGDNLTFLFLSPFLNISFI